MAVNLFVYGTLKRGFCRDRFLDDQRFVKVAQAKPLYRLYDAFGSYPALVEESDGVSVAGEVWEVDEECLRVLDQVEGVSQELYERRAIELIDWNDEDVLTYFYLQSTQGMADCGTSWPPVKGNG